MRGIQNLIEFIIETESGSILKRWKESSDKSIDFEVTKNFFHFSFNVKTDYYVPSEHGGVETYKPANAKAWLNMVIGFSAAGTPRVFCDLPTLAGMDIEKAQRFHEENKRGNTDHPLQIPNQLFYLLSEHDVGWKDGIRTALTRPYGAAVSRTIEVVEKELYIKIAPVQCSTEYMTRFFYPKIRKMEFESLPKEWVYSKSEKELIQAGFGLREFDFENYQEHIIQRLGSFKKAGKK